MIAGTGLDRNPDNMYLLLYIHKFIYVCVFLNFFPTRIFSEPSSQKRNITLSQTLAKSRVCFFFIITDNQLDVAGFILLSHGFPYQMMCFFTPVLVLLTNWSSVAAHCKNSVSICWIDKQCQKVVCFLPSRILTLSLKQLPGSEPTVTKCWSVTVYCDKEK